MLVFGFVHVCGLSSGRTYRCEKNSRVWIWSVNVGAYGYVYNRPASVVLIGYCSQHLFYTVDLDLFIEFVSLSLANSLGNAMEDDVNEFILAGVDGVLLKPLRTEQLDKIISFLKRYGNKRLSQSSVFLTSDQEVPFMTTRTVIWASWKEGYATDPFSTRLVSPFYYRNGVILWMFALRAI